MSESIPAIIDIHMHAFSIRFTFKTSEYLMKFNTYLFFSVICTMLMTPISDLIAQKEMMPVPGSRVRVIVSANGRFYYKGTLISLDADSLILSPDGDTTAHSFTIASLKKLELHIGQGTNKAVGAFLGGIVGFAVGAGIGAALIKIDSDSNFTTDHARLLGAGIGTLPGTLIGAAIGSNISREKWESVNLDQIRRGGSKKQ
jgi:hypothetical protein